MKKVRWGILGTADIARGCFIPGLQIADNAELYAVAGRNIDKANAFREQFGFEKAYGSYDELLDDSAVDAVYVPLPNHLHAEWAMKAMKKGKHVICEKPLAISKEQAQDMFRCARENGVFLMEAFAYLHSPYTKTLKEEISSGAIGKVRYIENAFIVQECLPDNIRLTKEWGGGSMYDLGVYCTSQMLYLLDSMPFSVRGCAEYSTGGVDLFTSVQMQFPEGITACFDCGMILPRSEEQCVTRLQIHGTEGSIRSNLQYFNQCGKLSYTVTNRNGTVEKTVDVPHNYALEAQQFGRCILNGESPLVTEDFSLRVAEITDTALDAIGF
ncbi:MAG: gfo/Idh/MocA family oxidoreductase [Clostridiales bacterium]|nr:gfo/Idh/MocA family oxidoreductase [Clostridiales bacterium]